MLEPALYNSRQASGNSRLALQERSKLFVKLFLMPLLLRPLKLWSLIREVLQVYIKFNYGVE
jgi:hypothetical protein